MPMSTPGIKARLRRLESAKRSPEGVYFIVWGRDETAIERALSNALAIGTVRPGDTVVRAVWPYEGVPASRWIGPRGLNPAEDAVLDVELERCAAMPLQENDAPAPPDFRANELSDEKLMALALGEVIRAR